MKTKATFANIVLLSVCTLFFLQNCSSAQSYPALSKPTAETWDAGLYALWSDFDISKEDQLELTKIGTKEDPRGAHGILNVKCQRTFPKFSDFLWCEGNFPTEKRGVCLGMALSAAMYARQKAGETRYGIELHCTTSFANVKYSPPYYEEGVIKVHANVNNHGATPVERTLQTSWN